MDLVIPKDIVIRSLTKLNRMAISKFSSGDLGEKCALEGASVPSNFWSLKKDTRTFNLR